MGFWKQKEYLPLYLSGSWFLCRSWCIVSFSWSVLLVVITLLYTLTHVLQSTTFFFFLFSLSFFFFTLHGSSRKPLHSKQKSSILPWAVCQSTRSLQLTDFCVNFHSVTNNSVLLEEVQWEFIYKHFECISFVWGTLQ